MALTNIGDLAGSVTAAGGFGFIGAAFANLINLTSELNLAVPKMANLPVTRKNSMLPIGIGVISFGMHYPNSKEGDTYPLLDFAIENKVAALWFSFGDSAELISYVRRKSPETLIFAQVQQPSEAVIAVRDWKVDVLVVQGSESGGHGAVENLTTFTLVPQVLAELEKVSLTVPILAAGGVTTGDQLAAALALGADGVVVGTGFLCTPESPLSVNQKNAIISAKDGSATSRTRVYDMIQGVAWPENVDGRALKNEHTTSTNLSPEDITRMKAEYKKAVGEDDISKRVTWVGQGLGLITDSRSAAEVVQKMTADAQNRIDKLTKARATNI
eukprot:Phypoly_transcript_12574.p1 GENE.Phypoly_transcript_12574~~Phypoly_transcript_12574.p1  ORF type:complete len:371 (+),score=47.27 Phypoly_transcript_12574:127-1113(+)